MTTVKDVLANKGGEVYRIEPAATVFEAIKEMVDRNCGALLVMHDDDIVGIITERDYLRNIALRAVPQRPPRSGRLWTVR
jgi:CBS domain-containing protein